MDWVIGFKANCPLMEPGPIGGVPSVGVFLRPPSPYLREFRRKPLAENTTSIFTLQFVDDQVIIAISKYDLDEMTIKFEEEYEKWGLHINVSKTKYLCIEGNVVVGFNAGCLTGDLGLWVRYRP